MEQNLQTIIELINNNIHLSEGEKAKIIASLKEVDEKVTVTEFKLASAEQVKRSTSILLEETIEQLELKRKAVEAQNRELEIEGSLERVRAIALLMKEPADMLEVCRIITEELDNLGVKEIRNVQTAIFYEDRGTYMNYVFYFKHDKTIITETSYTNHKIHQAFAGQMLKGNGEFFSTYINKDELPAWIAYQKTTNVFIDTYLEDASSLNYYWYSLGPIALGISTYQPLNEKDIELFKRFRNVFELAYRRYLDIEMAIAQAKEARIETALERVRAVAMAMRKSEELINVCEVMYKELTSLGFTNIRNAQIAIKNDARKSYTVYEYSDEVAITLEEAPYAGSPIVQALYNELGKSKEAIYQKEFSGEEFEDWRKWRQSLGTENDARLEEAHSMCFYLYSIGIGHLGISTLNAITQEQLETLKRFRNVFELSYRRYMDVARAETDAKEARIEAALEKVRSRSLAMHKSDELNEVVAVAYKKLEELNFSIDGAAFILTSIEGSKDVNGWLADSHNQSYATLFRIPYYDSPSINDFWNARESGVAFFSRTYSFEVKNHWFKYAFEHTDLKNLTDDLKNWILKQEYLTQAFAVAKNSILGLHFHRERILSENEIDILKRFSNVFEQGYVRFLDLQKAEAQAREAQIETALEKVRSRSLAVHKSDEFNEVIKVVFERLQELEIPMTSASINVFIEGSKDTEVYICGSGKDGLTVSHIRLVHFDHPIANDRHDAYVKGLEFFAKTYSAEEKNSFYEYEFEVSDLKYIPADIKKRVMESKPYTISLALTKNSMIVVNDFEGKSLSPKEIDIVKRFAKVFEQAYVRFLDLQKAEAQAREAQIENALEKVRSRTMAMQLSDELAEVAVVLFQQVKELGINTWTSGFNLWQEGNTSYIDWVVGPDGLFINPYTVDLTKHPFFKELSEAKQRGEDFHVYDLEGEYLAETYKLLSSYADKKQLEKILEFGFQIPARQINHYVFGLQVSLMFITLEPCPEAHDIFKRFGKVFEQIYTRFLDLQKAEAQAREAKIEAALERVRSRTMGMQKSEELKEVIQVVYEQFIHLNIHIEHTGFIMDYKARDDMHIWLADQHAVPSQVTIPYFDSAHWNSFNEAKEKGIDFFSNHLTFEEKNKFYQDLFKLIPGLPEETLQYYFGCPGLAISTVLLENVGLYIENFSGTPYLDEENKILMRFGKVFQQTYTRFLDLQKAETQAKEAKIEAALEKVRGRSLAMHKSNEIKDVVVTVMEKMHELNIEMNGGVSLVTFMEGSQDLLHWYINPGHVDKPETMHLPYFDNLVFNDFVDARKNSKELLPVVYSFEEKNKYFEYAFEHSEFNRAPQELKQWIFAQPYFSYSVAIQKHSAIFFNDYTGKLFSEKENEILIRFSKVFEQAYVRFLDLQKAEAQTREANIEASLERVRSKAMAMQKSEDLANTVAIVFEELDKLDVGTLRCGISIINKEKRSTNVWSTTKSEKGTTVQVTGDESMDIHPLLRGAFDAWLNGEDYSYLLQGEDLHRFYEALAATNFKLPDLQENAIKPGGPQQYLYVAHFPAGGLYAFGETAFSEEAKIVIRRFGEVFNLTYTRFNDLKQAEAQARESQIEASLERVRSKAMSMQKSEDLAVAVATVFEELDKLNLGMLRCGIGILDKVKCSANIWTTTKTGHGTAVQVSGDEPMNIHPLLQGAFDAWLEQKEDYSYVLQGEDLVRFYKALNVTNFKLPDSQSIMAGEGLQQYYYGTTFHSGGLYAFRETPLPEEAKTVMKRFADVFNFTYTRFSDLKHAEAQAREAKIETALERVRSRTLAMQKSDELAETSAVVFRQLINLGIEPNRLYIGIINDNSGNIEFWITDEDGTKVSTQFTGNINRSAIMAKMYTGWAQQKKSLTIDMQGKELEHYFHYLGEELKVPFKLGLSQKRRVQSIAYFAKGFIGIASPDEQSEETTSLLERFAGVFNLTFTRFNDLKIAEAHAIQAQLDLVQLQTEKKRAEDALSELKATQTQLIQSEKMASLGELTAGIAHEIQNPLNFVNNFSEVNTELIDELQEEVDKGNLDEVKAISNSIRENEQKINHHGKRADAIVKGMLQHSRSSIAVKEPTDINVLADEYIRLCYHGVRAKDKSFNTSIKTDFDETIGKVNIIPQDIGRVILNLLTNAFYEINEKKKKQPEGYDPIVSVSTKRINSSLADGGDKVEIKVTDNGNGIPQKVLDKIFQPFFTTKPTGQGTGLGLSLGYDIITKAHGGELKVETKEGRGTDFIIVLPLK